MKHFSIEEFACPCCTKVDMDAHFLAKIDLLRDRLGEPLVINSGFRCEKQNAKVSGSEHSAHMTGHAADISCVNSMMRFRLLREAIMLNFMRIGVADSFIHLDDDLTKPQAVTWIY